MKFADQINAMENQGYRWVVLGAVRVLMTNGSQWAVGAKYDHAGDDEFKTYATFEDAMDAYRRIANPYSDVQMDKAAE